MLQNFIKPAKITKKCLRRFVIYMNVVPVNAKFSYNIIKGSVKSRQKIVSELNEKFFESSLVYINNKRVLAEDLKKIFIKILPEKKIIEIKKFKPTGAYAAASDYTYDKNENIKGLSLEIPFLNSKMSSKDIPTLMHELTHIFATLTNPKHTALSQKMLGEDKYKNHYNNWYQNVLYNDEKITQAYTVKDMLESVKESTLHLLENKKNHDKVNFLQDARYELQQELDAHKEQLKYAQKLKNMGFDVNENDLVDEDRYFFFTEKIQLLNEILADVLAKTRKKNSSKIMKKESSTLKLNIS